MRLNGVQGIACTYVSILPSKIILLIGTFRDHLRNVLVFACNLSDQE